jgi:hypothetical protein
MNSEWNFITKEVHKESQKLIEKNGLKREMLFMMQVLLGSKYPLDNEIYWKMKKLYLER